MQSCKYTIIRPIVAAALLTWCGCSGGSGAIKLPKLNASAAAGTAIEMYDTNGDGQLAKDEWMKSAALSAVASHYDKNSDGTLTREEIAQGLAAWQQTGVGARMVPFEVRLNGQPLAGASVRLVPAP